MIVFTVLGIVFLMLKLAAIVTWPWWFVLLPFLPGVVVFCFVIFVAVMAAVLKELQ